MAWRILLCLFVLAPGCLGLYEYNVDKGRLW